jgi:hypothetical protein
MLRELVCPSYFRHGSASDEHHDLWNIVCSQTAIKSAWQCRQLLLTYAWRIGHHNLAPAHPPPPLKLIKRGVTDGTWNEEDQGSDQELVDFDIFS